MDEKNNMDKAVIINTMEENTVEQKNNEINYMKEIVHMVLYFFIVICSVLFIHNFIGQQIEVSGSSMESTLHDKDHLILEKLTYQFDEPERYDIVVFQPYVNTTDSNTFEDVYYIKRVIGLPGESVQIVDSDIYIDGTLLEENYGKNEIVDSGIASDEIVLTEDEYFLLGDNRNNSKDSRDDSIGAVKRSAIIGRAWIKVWPFKDFEVLEHQ